MFVHHIFAGAQVFLRDVDVYVTQGPGLLSHGCFK